jgi:hypothetical protein
MIRSTKSLAISLIAGSSFDRDAQLRRVNLEFPTALLFRERYDDSDALIRIVPGRFIRLGGHPLHGAFSGERESTPRKRRVPYQADGGRRR